MNLKVLLIDDHRLFREGLQSLLQRRNIEVLAAVGDGSEGMKLARELRPDIILLDMRMPIIDGISVLKQLKQRELSMPIVILTTSSNEQDLLDALKYGASGYLLKDMDPDALVIALRDINSGKTVVAPHLTSVLVRFVQGDTNTTEEQGPFNNLTPREREILKLIADGQGNKLIARNLGISDGTVKLHVKAVLRKLEVHSRVEAAVMYIEHYYQSRILSEDRGRSEGS
ncbi:MAG: response regulator [Gammaproteobacteria bacterium]|nr:response regulator [Gammaproteobacteria bacterium]MCZ6883363.1 response regulator [Gammaproteobacteria bacterium]